MMPPQVNLADPVARAALRAKTEADALARGSWATWEAQKHLLPATRAVPAGWKLVREGRDGRAFLSAGRHMSVIESVAREDDGRVWHHVSMARRDRDPHWEELRAVKEAFIGDREAYLVLPPRARYVNQHAHCLHLWSCLSAPDGVVLPDFAAFGRGVGSL